MGLFCGMICVEALIALGIVSVLSSASGEPVPRIKIGLSLVAGAAMFGLVLSLLLGVS